METKTDEIAEGVYRFSTAVMGIGPEPFTFNQFLIKAETPMLFHMGQRGFFAGAASAAGASAVAARSTSCISAIGAESPARGIIRRIRV